MEKIENQTCPFCLKKTLTLIEDEKEIPYFGKVFILSMKCSNCNYNKSDVEPEKIGEPSRYTLETDNKKDLQIRVVKSSTAKVKIPTFRMEMTPGPASEGFVSNIEGVIKRFKEIVESQKDDAEDKDIRKKAKNLLKKIRKAEEGEIPVKIIIEDSTGNSAIISEKAKVEKIKK